MSRIPLAGLAMSAVCVVAIVEGVRRVRTATRVDQFMLAFALIVIPTIFILGFLTARMGLAPGLPIPGR